MVDRERTASEGRPYEGKTGGYCEKLAVRLHRLKPMLQNGTPVRVKRKTGREGRIGDWSNA
jgi:hypothetical protein